MHSNVVAMDQYLDDMIDHDRYRVPEFVPIC